MKSLLSFLLSVSITVHAFAQTPITGVATVCEGATTTLSNSTSGGTWSSGDPTIATVGATTGIVTAVGPGTAAIGYMTSSWIVSKIVTVNALPTLSSALTPPAICDSFTFSYTPVSATPATSFTWMRTAIPGIANVAASGSGNPNEALINTSTNPIGVVYRYALVGGGCMNTQNVTVMVNPHPTLSSPLTIPDIIDAGTVDYTPSSATSGVTYSWSRAAVAGITPATSFYTSVGPGVIHEVLYNSTTSPVTTAYCYRLTINGCTNLSTECVTVVVNPSHVSVSSVTTASPLVTIYPIPSNGSVTVDVTNVKAEVSMSIYDIMGRTVLSNSIQQAGHVQHVLELGDLPHGVYQASINVDGIVYNQKVVMW